MAPWGRQPKVTLSSSFPSSPSKPLWKTSSSKTGIFFKFSHFYFVHKTKQLFSHSPLLCSASFWLIRYAENVLTKASNVHCLSSVASIHSQVPLIASSLWRFLFSVCITIFHSTINLPAKALSSPLVSQAQETLDRFGECVWVLFVSVFFANCMVSLQWVLSVCPYKSLVKL